MTRTAPTTFAAILILMLTLPQVGFGADGPTESGQAPPTAPAPPMRTATSSQMAAAMGMDDAAALGKVMLDQLELDGGSSRQAAWDTQAWYGTDYDKLWLKSEGQWASGYGAVGRNEALWDRALLRWWDAQLGIRYDSGPGPARSWAAIGLQGLAPYSYDVEATLYLADAGRTALRFKIEHDFLFTQRLILQPELETDLYSRSDPARDVGSGFSDLQLALRLRYETRRELAPYLGVAWRCDLGDTAQLAHASGREPRLLQWVAGAHIWF